MRLLESKTLRSPFIGKRIQFRQIKEADAEIIQQWFNHPTVRGKFYLDNSINPWLDVTLAQIKKILDKWSKAEDETNVIIESLEEKNPIGLASWNWHWDTHSPDFNLFIAPDFQGKGYGSEALQLILGYLFTSTPAHVVSIWIYELDTDRITFFTKEGFQNQGMMRRAQRFENKDVGYVVFDLLKREWESRKKNNQRKFDL